MNEHDLAKRVAQRLEEGLDQLPAGTLFRLRTAREAALARAHRHEPAVAMVGAGVLSGASGWLTSRRILAPLTALVLAVLVLYWQQLQQPHSVDNADFDAQMLTDDLPVTAYTDQGFEVWLHERSFGSSEQ